MRTSFSLVCCLLLWLHSFSYCPVRDSLLKVAEAEIGVAETSENFSPRIYEYQLACGWNTPVPWCACYITWVYRQLGLPTPLYHAVAKAWTDVNCIEHTRQIMPGDIGSIYYSALGRVGHAFIIEAIDADDCYTLEGNTRNWTDKHDRVMRKVRPIATVYRFSNWIGDKYHTVYPGENLYRIGLKYGVSVDELKRLNNLSGDFIRVEEVLTVECK